MAELFSFSWLRKRDLLSIFWTVLLILFLRVYLVEPFKIPTGSMIPTLLVGDHLFVAKSSYDLGLPLSSVKIVALSEPRRSDVVVFEYPNHEEDKRKNGYFYIKRLIGLPGDVISIQGGIPTINGQKAEVEEISPDDPRLSQLSDFNPASYAKLYLERLPGTDAAHWVQRYESALERLKEDLPLFKREIRRDCLDVAESLKNPSAAVYRSIAVNEICEFQVPESKYFMMGDNRDDSEDGRIWGFVDRSQLKGRALFVFLAIAKPRFSVHAQNSDQDPEAEYFNWSRFGLPIK